MPLDYRPDLDLHCSTRIAPGRSGPPPGSAWDTCRLRPLGKDRRMSFSARAGAAVGLCAVALAVAGCGETVIDSAKVQAAIQSNLEKALHHKVSSVSCPSEQKVTPDTTFTCLVSFSDGRHVTATLKILNKEADVSMIGLRASK